MDRIASSIPPRISVLYNFLQFHLLDPNDVSLRDTKYSAKGFSELVNNCHSILGLQENYLTKHTPDSLIDLFTVCMPTGCHAFPSSSPLSYGRYPSSLMRKNDRLKELLSKHKTRFTVIYGNNNDRTAHYMTQQTIYQLEASSRNTSFDSYESSTLPADVSSWLKPRYKNEIPQLYPAIINAYLNYQNDLFFIIYNIPSQDALNTLITNCRLIKNVILICDYDVESPENSDEITYIPFHEISSKPELEDIKIFLQNHAISDEDGNFAQTLLNLSHQTPYILYATELLIQNWGNENDLNNLKNILSTLSLQDAENMLPKGKYNMSTPQSKTRSRYSLAGHIFKLYKSILSIDEFLMLVFIVLNGEDGLSEKWITHFLPENALLSISSLTKKGFVCKREDTYIYTDSLLIPYAFLYSGQFQKDDKKVLFHSTLSLCDSLLDELCYNNTQPIDYGILRSTIRQIFNSLFTLLRKSDDDYYEHFSEIWYLHLRCTRFLLENGDCDTLQELYDNFQPLAEKLTSRPSEDYKYWKKLYDLYERFINLHLQLTSPQPDFHKNIVKIVEQTISIVEKHAQIIFTQPDHTKILLSFIEFCISDLLRLYLINIQQERFDANSEENGFFLNY